MSLRRPKDEGERWISVSLASFGVFALLVILTVIVPSYWLYFADGTLRWTSEFLQALRDIVVTGYYAVALVALAVATVIWQKRNERILPGDEEKREATGGYK
jgi:uncharacterized membrane protein YpjA